MSTKQLKDDLKDLGTLFPRTHPFFQIRSCDAKEINIRAYLSKDVPVDITGNILDPESPVVWSSEGGDQAVSDVLEVLSNAEAEECHIFRVFLEMISRFTKTCGWDMKKEIEFLEAKVRSPNKRKKTEDSDAVISDEDLMEDQDFEQDLVTDDVDDLGMNLEDWGAKKPSNDEDDDIKGEDLAMIERISTAVAEKKFDGSSVAIGSVQANDRLLKEIKHIYKSESYKKKVFSIKVDEANMYLWDVMLYKDSVDSDSLLYGDFIKMKEKTGVDHIHIALKFPPTFPMLPPFVRVISPCINGGHVTQAGAVCMELLTNQGWSSAYTVEAVILQIAATFITGDGRINSSYKPGSAYNEALAIQSAERAARIHAETGWYDEAPG